MDNEQEQVEAALLKLALSHGAAGQIEAIMFYLCNRHPDRWQSINGNVADFESRVEQVMEDHRGEYV